MVPSASSRPEARAAESAASLLPSVSVMAVSQDLLDLLVCPVCKAPVSMTPDQKGLKCAQCHRIYPIRDDIPVMLVDEARIEESAE